MAFKRTGTCNQCGECCGYPRTTDGGQNNPWAKDLPECIRNWSDEAITIELPVFKRIGYLKDRDRKFGMVQVGTRRCYWIIVPGHGLCTDKTPHGDPRWFDQRCPFLSEKLPDGTVPCLLYNSKNKYIWERLCKPTPPEEFPTQERVDKWFKNCPGCSFKYE